MRTIIGIDPGASGGIAYLLKGSTAAVDSMPDTEGDISAHLSAIDTYDIVRPIAFIEENTGFCGKQIPSHTMFKLGRNTGFLHGACSALGFRIEQVRPQEWQKALGLGTSKGMSKTQWKNKLKAKAQQLYPHIKVTLQTADALLILEYGRMKTK